jgi:hypothetical protein
MADVCAEISSGPRWKGGIIGFVDFVAIGSVQFVALVEVVIDFRVDLPPLVVDVSSRPE